MREQQGKNKHLLDLKKQEAKYLFIVKGFTQKQIAGIIKVSEVTLSTWQKKYQWKDEAVKEQNLQGGVLAFIHRFITYIKLEKSAQFANEFKKLWDAFLKEENKSF